MNARNLPRLLLLLLLPALLMSCERVFTYTPLEFLQRSLANMSAAQLMTYAENALASGDIDAMKAAYEALKNDTTDAGKYMAAQLAIEISGISGFLLDVVSGATALPATGDSSSLTDWITANGGSTTSSYLIAAGDKLSSLEDTSGLTTMDYVYGSLGMTLDAATQTDGSINFAAMDAAKLTEAQAFVQEALTGMSTDDPSYSFLDSYNSFLTGL